MKVFWTDGSASPNPGPGGYAVIDQATGKPVALGRGARTTNIRMEGFALGMAMKLAGEEECEIHTDSEFWVNVLTKWAPKWKENGWRRKVKAQRGDQRQNGGAERDAGKSGESKKKDEKSERGGAKYKPIQNLDIVLRLYDRYSRGNIKLVWERGHAGTALNELADQWAKRARRGKTFGELELGVDKGEAKVI